MIRGLHGMIYSSDASASRAFVRDKLRLPFTDVGRGWLIFDLPLADIGFHPAGSADGDRPGSHDLSFFCDDIAGTMKELERRGVRFKHPPADHGYGYVTFFEIPGGIEVQLYEPKYEKRTAPRAGRKPASKKRAKSAKRTKPAKTKPKAKTRKPR